MNDGRKRMIEPYDISNLTCLEEIIRIYVITLLTTLELLPLQAFCPKCAVPIELLNFTIILSHANSSLNPLLYAYHLKEFRIAMKNALLVLFEKMVCGMIKTSSHKEAVPGPFSRSQTLPSLAQTTAALGASTGKVSMKFHRSPNNTFELSRSVQISPNKNCLIISANSRDNLSRTTAMDKSLTSLSMGSDMSSQVIQENHEPVSNTRDNKQSPSNNIVGKVKFIKKSVSANDELVIQSRSHEISSQSSSVLCVLDKSQNGKLNGSGGGSSAKDDHVDYIPDESKEGLNNEEVTTPL
jgi:hypothetical protein